MKKIFALLLALFMIIPLFMSSALAEGDTCFIYDHAGIFTEDSHRTSIFYSAGPLYDELGVYTLVITEPDAISDIASYRNSSKEYTDLLNTGNPLLSIIYTNADAHVYLRAVNGAENIMNDSVLNDMISFGASYIEEDGIQGFFPACIYYGYYQYTQKDEPASSTVDPSSEPVPVPSSEPVPDPEPSPEPSYEPSALYDTQYLYDYADLLTEEQEKEIQVMLYDLHNIHNGNHVIVITNDVEGKSSMDYADDFFDYNGFGPDGSLLLINMEDREWWISTTGFMIDVLTDSDISRLGDAVTDDLKSESYYEGFREYIRNLNSELDDYEYWKEQEASKKPEGSNTQFVIDNAGLFNVEEAAQLQADLQRFRDIYGFDVVVITQNSSSDYVDVYNLFEYQGYKSEGYAVILNTENNTCEYVPVNLYGVLDDKAQKTISVGMDKQLKNNNLKGALSTFLHSMDIEAQGHFSTKERVYSGSTFMYRLLKWWRNIKLGGILAGLGIASATGFTTTGAMKKGMKTTRTQNQAHNYIKDGSFNLTNAQDIFLYSHTSRQRIHVDNDRSSGGGFSGGGSSTHVSSSGTTHGGGGGKF